ncbi:molybdenum cofactor guanylyltransferase [bacterium]|nr:molybdenum cofactor guanylyltransferase [bacterium]
MPESPVHPSETPVAGAVLAGGKSERLERRPKALLPVGENGSPLVAAAVALLERLADPVLVSTGDAARFEFLGKRIVLDREPGLGPLGGILSVLEANPHERCLVVACDMPFLSLSLLKRLVALARENPSAGAVVPRTARGLHPLHAVYGKALLPLLRERARSRKLALHEALALGGALEVPESELRRFDPDLRSLENLNTRSDLARVLGEARADDVLSALRPDP